MAQVKEHIVTVSEGVRTVSMPRGGWITGMTEVDTGPAGRIALYSNGPGADETRYLFMAETDGVSVPDGLQYLGTVKLLRGSVGEIHVFDWGWDTDRNEDGSEIVRT